jgi:hypothetical protein
MDASLALAVGAVHGRPGVLCCLVGLTVVHELAWVMRLGWEAYKKMWAMRVLVWLSTPPPLRLLPLRAAWAD